MAAGSILGGLLVGAIGGGGALGVIAACQLVAIVLVLGGGAHRPHRSSSPAGFDTGIAATAASETPPV